MVDPSIRALIEEWDGLAVLLRHDAAAGAWIFIALHDDTLGMMMGGCRVNVYPRPEEGLLDALRLARGMTHKWAAVDFPFGGGKSVVALSRPVEGEERTGLLKRYAHVLGLVDGRYATGPDLGTTPEDMDLIRSVTPNVMGGPAWIDGYDGDPGPFTALGVYSGMRAALRHVFGDDGVEDRRVLIQGLGDVGLPLARYLAADGAKLVVTDVDDGKLGRVAEELGAEVVEPDGIYDVECDVYAPCAVGATLNAESIPRLRCRVVAGSANNQLATEEDGERIHQRGILYTPDFVINGGGAVAFGLMYGGERDFDAIRERMRGIGDSVTAILEEAQERGEAPSRTALRRAERVLAAAGARRA